MLPTLGARARSRPGALPGSPPPHPPLRGVSPSCPVPVQAPANVRGTNEGTFRGSSSSSFQADLYPLTPSRAIRSAPPS